MYSLIKLIHSQKGEKAVGSGKEPSSKSNLVLNRQSYPLLGTMIEHMDSPAVDNASHNGTNLFLLTPSTPMLAYLVMLSILKLIFTADTAGQLMNRQHRQTS